MAFLERVPFVQAIRQRESHRKRCRAIRVEIAQIEAQYTPRMKTADDDEYRDLASEFLAETHHLDHQLDWLESGPLIRTARAFGLDPGNENVLNRHQRQQLKKRIIDGRFVYWKGWADVVVPILSLVVAILALLRPNGCAN